MRLNKMSMLFTTESGRKRALRFLLPFVLIASASSSLAQVGDFGGPSILSRAGASPGTRGSTPLNFTVFGGIGGTITNNPTLGTSGDLFYGESVNVGATGSHAWSGSQLGIDYAGSFRHYSPNNFGNGIEQSLSLFYVRRLSRRFTMSVSENAAITNLALGGLSTLNFFSNDLIGVPFNNLLNSRAYSTQTSGTLTWKPTARFALSFYGDAFQVHRTNKALVGLQGYRAGARAGYRLSRSDEATIDYSFIHFGFPRAFGASDLHGIQAGLNHSFSKYWKARLAAGAYRIETLGTESVPLDPEIAAILGQATGVQAVYRISYAPNVSASLSYAYQRSNFILSVADEVSPGNGIYLTAKTASGNLGYSYSGFKKASFSANFGYVHYSSLFQNIGNYGSWMGGVGTGYRFTDHLSATLSVDARQYQIAQGGNNQLSESATIGIVWAPYRVPIPSF